MFFATAAVIRRRHRALIGAGIVLGTTAGLVRVVNGAHFVSDVVFAGVFMAMTVAGLYFLFEARSIGGLARVRLAIYGGSPAI